MVDVGVAHRPRVERDRPHLRRPADDRHLGRADLVGVAAGGELDPGGLQIVGRALRHALLEEGVAAALLAGREHDPGCTPLGQRSSVVGRCERARMMPSSTAR
jgi:hypothetical protein